MDSDDLKHKLGIDDDGTYRVNPDTGVVEKQGLFGWNKTDTRVEPASGDVQEWGMFGWKGSDTRIDPESGVVKEWSIFGYRDTDTRVDPRTGNIQEHGILGWKDTDERIDPETGNVQEHGILGWKDKTRRKDIETHETHETHETASYSECITNPSNTNIVANTERDTFRGNVIGYSILIGVIILVLSLIIQLIGKMGNFSDLLQRPEHEPTSFSVTIDSSPSGATVFIDKKQVGITPYSTTIEKGSYGIRVEKEGYENAYGITEGEKQEFNFKLKED